MPIETTSGFKYKITIKTNKVKEKKKEKKKE